MTKEHDRGLADSGFLLHLLRVAFFRSRFLKITFRHDRRPAVSHPHRRNTMPWALIPLRNNQPLGSNTIISLEKPVGRRELLEGIWKACGCQSGTCDTCSTLAWGKSALSRQLLRVFGDDALQVRGSNAHRIVRIHGKPVFEVGNREWSGNLKLKEGMLLTLQRDDVPEAVLEYRVTKTDNETLKEVCPSHDNQEEKRVCCEDGNKVSGVETNKLSPVAAEGKNNGVDRVATDARDVNEFEEGKVCESSFPCLPKTPDRCVEVANHENDTACIEESNHDNREPPESQSIQGTPELMERIRRRIEADALTWNYDTGDEDSDGSKVAAKDGLGDGRNVNTVPAGNENTGAASSSAPRTVHDTQETENGKSDSAPGSLHGAQEMENVRRGTNEADETITSDQQKNDTLIGEQSTVNEAARPAVHTQEPRPHEELIAEVDTVDLVSNPSPGSDREFPRYKLQFVHLGRSLSLSHIRILVQVARGKGAMIAESLEDQPTHLIVDENVLASAVASKLGFRDASELAHVLKEVSQSCDGPCVNVSRHEYSPFLFASSESNRNCKA